MGIAEARETIRACRYCFMCRYACPTFLATKRESVTPRGYALLLMQIDAGKQAWTEDFARAFYQCSLCGLCREDCEYGWAEDDLVRHAHEAIVSAGHAPQAVQAAAATLLADGAAGWPEQGSLPVVAAGRVLPQVLYLAGCQARRHHPEIVAATAQLLTATGVEWGVLAEESCCGGGLYDLGYPAEAKEKARALAAQIAELNPRTVVTGCAHCARSLREWYPAWGVELPAGIELLHSAEYFEGMAAAGRLKLDGRGEEAGLGYHDPCQLGRKLGVYDAPRALIQAAAGSAPRELFHSRALAECCGAGAAAFLAEPGVARQVARVRLERAAEAGVTTLVTACQNCKALLQEAAGDEIGVIDLAELIARHIV